MPPNPNPKPTPISYVLIRWLFKFVLKVFYGTIVIENVDYIPKKGEACILCANHTNSLTDALLLMTASKNFLRMTAKSTQFGRGTFSSWLIEASGALPLHRRMDFPNLDTIDNTAVMNKLYDALEDGDAICLFPEGMSRYLPALSPLKTGVARIISEVLTRRREDPNYEITLLTCSITYMHRHHFRSDVLVRFNPPVKFSPKKHPNLLAPVDFGVIKTLTNFMADQISTGTLDAPSWDVITVAKVAARIYAPLGTKMTLGDHVKVVRTFVEGFKKTGKGWNQYQERSTSWDEGGAIVLKDDVDVLTKQEDARNHVEVDRLAQDLMAYHNKLLKMGIKDDRVRIGWSSRRTILLCIAGRGVLLGVLSLISLPGLILWTPVFAATKWSANRFKKRGPQEDVWDEIAQHKLLVGLFTGCCVWLGCIIMTLPIAPLTAIFVPCLMWLSLRFLEDAVSAFRALAGLLSLLWIGRRTFMQLSDQRRELHGSVKTLAVNALELPDNPEKFFSERGGREKGRVRGTWESSTRYFSIKRRRKRDWNEILRIWPHEE
ncbi:hypothetical protein BU17DRAFT_100471 [Hysterangium stoloniferum]|nr:hypothetical protein BU17DRAFT_100471 [Hysterangium stoloniferum]